MPLHNGIPSIIHQSTVADLTAYTYTKVYCSRATTVTVNDASFTMLDGVTLDVVVRSITPNADIFLLGDKINTSDPGGTEGIIL